MKHVLKAESQKRRQAVKIRKGRLKEELRKKKELAKTEKEMKRIESDVAKIEKKAEKVAEKVESKKKRDMQAEINKESKKALRKEYDRYYYARNADVKREQQIKNYRKRKGTWNQFHDFGKKIRSGPTSFQYKDKTSTSSTSVNLSTINDNSSPEEVRNGLMENAINSDGTDCTKTIMDNLKKNYIQSTYVGDSPNEQQANILLQ